MKKKAMALAAALLMVGLAGCGTASSSTSTEASPSSAPASSEAASAAEAVLEEAPSVQEAEPAGQVIPQTVRYFRNLWDDERMNYSIDCYTDGIRLLDGEHPALEAALAEKAVKDREAVDNFYDNCEKELKEMGGEDYSLPWGCEITMDYQRSDNTIFSFVEENYSWMGGAHPYWYRTGYNYDPQTGKRLSINDIAEDPAALQDTVLRLLDEQKEKAGFLTAGNKPQRTALPEKTASACI